MDDRRLSALVAAVIVIVVLGVLIDVTRRTMGRTHPSLEAAAGVLAVPDTLAPAFFPSESSKLQPASGDSTPRAASGAGDQAAGGLTRPAERSPSYMELVARAETRRQIRASAAMTYLSDIVTASDDSMLHRWDNRITRPVRVYLAPARAANYQPAFLDAVRSAFRTWEDAVPVRFDPTADSANAEVHVYFKIQFDIDRTGQTDLVWNEQGHIQHGVITLATFDPEGRPMGVEEIRIVALHEIGHLIGLDHSPDSGDLMFSVTTTHQLSRRDVETARLLYRLAPGSIR